MPTTTKFFFFFEHSISCLSGSLCLSRATSLCLCVCVCVRVRQQTLCFWSFSNIHSSIEKSLAGIFAASTREQFFLLFFSFSLSHFSSTICRRLRPLTIFNGIEWVLSLFVLANAHIQQNAFVETQTQWNESPLSAYFILRFCIFVVCTTQRHQNHSPVFKWTERDKRTHIQSQTSMSCWKRIDYLPNNGRFFEQTIFFAERILFSKFETKIRFAVRTRLLCNCMRWLHVCARAKKRPRANERARIHNILYICGWNKVYRRVTFHQKQNTKKKKKCLVWCSLCSFILKNKEKILWKTAEKK